MLCHDLFVGMLGLSAPRRDSENRCQSAPEVAYALLRGTPPSTSRGSYGSSKRCDESKRSSAAALRAWFSELLRSRGTT